MTKRMAMSNWAQICQKGPRIFFPSKPVPESTGVAQHIRTFFSQEVCSLHYIGRASFAVHAMFINNRMARLSCFVSRNLSWLLHFKSTHQIIWFFVSLYFSEFIAKVHIFRDLSPYRPFQELIHILHMTIYNLKTWTMNLDGKFLTQKPKLNHQAMTFMNSYSISS